MIDRKIFHCKNCHLLHYSDWSIIQKVWEQWLCRYRWIFHIDLLQFSTYRECDHFFFKYFPLLESVMPFVRLPKNEYFVLYYRAYSVIIFLERKDLTKNTSTTFHKDHKKWIYRNKTTIKNVCQVSVIDLYFQCLCYWWNIIRMIFNKLI